MIKKTIDVIKENPIILMIYGVFFLIPILTILLTDYLGLSELLSGINNMDENTGQILTMSISLLITLVTMVFTQIPIRRYTGNVLQNRSMDNWYFDAVRTCWWKDIMLIIICIAAALPTMFFVTFIFIQLGIVGIIIEAIALIIIISLIMLGRDIIIVEDEFKTGLKNMFLIGKRYILKYFAVFIIWAAGSTLLAYLGRLDVFTQIKSLKVEKDILSYIFNVLLFSYLSTYNIVNYLHHREMAEQEEAIEEEETPTESDDDYEKLDDSISEKIRDKFLYK